MDIIKVREIYNTGNVMWTKHSLQRMNERNILSADVSYCILNGEIIECYENDNPYPSCLIFSRLLNKKVLHVVVSINENMLYVITAYYPSLDIFDKNMKTRRVK